MIEISVRYIIIPNGKDSHDTDVVITSTNFENEDLGLFS